MNILKRLFRKHDYQWVRNSYGDEIRYLGWKRSVWKCSKCGKYKLENNLYKEDEKWTKQAKQK